MGLFESWIWVDGYKATNFNMCCINDFQYELNKMYSIPKRNVKECAQGFHFCLRLKDTLSYYPIGRYFKVKALVRKKDYKGVWIDTKLAAAKIILLEEIPIEEVLDFNEIIREYTDVKLPINNRTKYIMKKLSDVPIYRDRRNNFCSINDVLIGKVYTINSIKDFIYETIYFNAIIDSNTNINFVDKFATIKNAINTYAIQNKTYLGLDIWAIFFTDDNCKNCIKYSSDNMVLYKFIYDFIKLNEEKIIIGGI